MDNITKVEWRAYMRYEVDDEVAVIELVMFVTEERFYKTMVNILRADFGGNPIHKLTVSNCTTQTIVFHNRTPTDFIENFGK